MASRQFEIETNKFCFLCMRVSPGSANSPANISSFLKVCQYLKIDLPLIFRQTSRNPAHDENEICATEKWDVTGKFCGGCKSVVDSLSDLFDELGAVKQKVRDSLFDVRNRFQEGEADGSRVAAFTTGVKTNPDIHVNFVEVLRKQVLEKCKYVLEKKSPEKLATLLATRKEAMMQSIIRQKEAAREQLPGNLNKTASTTPETFVVRWEKDVVLEEITLHESEQALHSLPIRIIAVRGSNEARAPGELQPSTSSAAPVSVPEEPQPSTSAQCSSTGFSFEIIKTVTTSANEKANSDEQEEIIYNEELESGETEAISPKSGAGSEAIPSNRYGTRKTRLQCKQCSRRFRFRKDLNLHTQRLHAGNTALCKTCPKAFQTAFGLSIHFGKIHKKEVKQEPGLEGARTTLVESRVGRKRQCGYCATVFSRSKYYTHRRSCVRENAVREGGNAQANHLADQLACTVQQPQDTVECDFCHMVFDNVQGLAIHFINFHGTEEIQIQYNEEILGESALN